MSSSGRSVDLIVTDLGGTLVKTDEAIMAAVRRAAGELGIPPGYAEPVYDVFGTSIWEYIRAYLPEGHKHCTNDCHERFWTLFPYAVLEQIAPFAGTEQALDDLKRRGVRLAVLSGLRLEAIESILSTLAFRDWDAVRSSLMYPTESGDSRAFGIIDLVETFGVLPGRTIYIGDIDLVETFGVLPGRTIYIGDTDHDVRQARKAGVLSAVVKTGGQAVRHLPKIEAQKPDYLLDSFADLR
ncbi:MAG: HAD family hydrolase [Planctomycetes bacterium]|nr:HAD family hydrolase [Planctomycetota bacterium]